jgi:hypothetical protein
MRDGVLLIVVGIVGACGSTGDPWANCPSWTRGPVTLTLVHLPDEHSAYGLDGCPVDPGPQGRHGEYWRDATQTLGCACPDKPEFIDWDCVGYPMCVERFTDGTPEISHYVQCTYWAGQYCAL